MPYCSRVTPLRSIRVRVRASAIALMAAMLADGVRPSGHGSSITPISNTMSARSRRPESGWLVMPITAPGDKAEIGSVQSHWPGCNVRGLCCAGNANNNYAVVFPPSATPEQKARLLSAVHLIDLNMFERRQNQK